MKSAENRPNKQYAVVESCPEVDGAVYRSGVYKILMARMWLTTTDKTRMKVSRRKNGRNAVATKVVCVRSSKAVAMKDLAVLQASPSTLAKGQPKRIMQR